LVYTGVDGFICYWFCCLFGAKTFKIMSREFSKFLTKILLAAVVLAIAGWIIFSFFVPQHYLPVLPWMLLFFVLVTLLTHGYQLRVAKKDMVRFTRISMIMSMLRLALYSLFAIVYLANNSEKAAVFVVCLVTVYIVFTIIEVANLARVTRKQ
jgi:ABC-type dipeptide/oligopeptide/nickel transport system permease subunit